MYDAAIFLSSSSWASFAAKNEGEGSIEEAPRGIDFDRRLVLPPRLMLPPLRVLAL
jgi:hypothetical protein